MIYSLIDRRNDVKMFNNQVVSVLRSELKWPLSLKKNFKAKVALNPL